jgi:poly(A) polymerase
LLFSILENSKIEARFVGGCVRDGLLGIETDDLDLAVNADVDKIRMLLNASEVKYLDTGIKYGSVTVLINDKKFEITSLRIDKECFGRDCTVIGTTNFEEDAKRRDFTINAIYVSKSGELFDYFNGISDLIDKKIVKFIGDPSTRIEEDALRIFRYYRMCAKLGDLRNEYHDAIKQKVECISKISIERVQKELFPILISEHSFKIIQFMIEAEVLNKVFSVINVDKLFEITHSLLGLEGRLYLLFETEELLSKLRLKRASKSQIKSYKNFEAESQLYSLYKKGKAFLREIQEIQRIKFGIGNKLPEILCDPMPVFPLNFTDLPSNTKDAHKRIVECERWWVNHNFQKNKEECLKHIEQIN